MLLDIHAIYAYKVGGKLMYMLYKIY